MESSTACIWLCRGAIPAILDCWSYLQAVQCCDVCEVHLELLWEGDVAQCAAATAAERLSFWTYGAQVLHANLASLSGTKTAPYLVMFLTSNLGGWAGDYLITQRITSTAGGRKAVNTIGIFRLACQIGQACRKADRAGTSEGGGALLNAPPCSSAEASSIMPSSDLAV